MNEKHIHEHSGVTQAETLALLRDNSKAAADELRQFTDEDLDQAATVSLNGDAPLTFQFVIEDHVLRHSFIISSDPGRSKTELKH